MKRNQPNAQYVHETLFGRELGKIFSSIKKVQSGKFITGYGKHGEPVVERSMRYRIPPLQDCRRMFEDFIGQPIPWSEESNEWLGDIEPVHDYSGLDNGGSTPF